MKKVVLLALGAACALTLAGGGAARQLATIRFSVGIDTAYAPIFVAKNEGIFQKYGLDVNVIQFAQGGEGVDAMLAGAIDVGGSGDATVLGKSVRGPLKAFAIWQDSGDYIKLVVRKDINDIKEIKKFGYVPGSLSQYGMFKALDAFNVPRASIKFVPGGPPEMPALLNRGDIDAFVIWEPWPTRSIELGSGKVLMRTKNFGYTYVLMLVSSANWFAANQDSAQRLVRAVAEATKITEQRPNLAAADTLKETKIPEVDSLRAVQQIRFGMRDFTDNDMKTFEQISDFLVEQKIASKRPSPTDLVVRNFVALSLIPKSTAKADTLVGTIGDDTINGAGGDDKIFGLAGNDTLGGDTGNDTVDGGLDNDSIDGGAGNDTLIGAAGVDHVTGGAGNDVIRVRDRAKDTVDCGAGRDTVYYNRGDKLKNCERKIRG